MIEKEALLKSPLFRGISPDELADIAIACEQVSISAGRYVYETDTPGEYFYLVLNGEVELIARRDEKNTCMIARIGEGGHFGESALLTGRRRSLSVRTVSDVLLGRFTSSFFREILLANIHFHLELDKALVNRLRYTMPEHADFMFEHKRIFLQPEYADLYPFFEGGDEDPAGLEEAVPKSLKIVQQNIKKFAADLDPVIIIGESGTGRKSVARKIHNESTHREGPYGVIDLRQFASSLLESKLFGHDPGSLAFVHFREAGILEQFRGGTIVLYHAELLENASRRKLLDIIKNGCYSRIGGNNSLNLEARIIFICGGGESKGNFCNFEQSQKEFLQNRMITMPPLREHKRDIPRLVEYYLSYFNREYSRNVQSIDNKARGILMNYDWPGNMTELRNVIQRAVLLAEEGEILSEQILLGLPQPEGKLEYNLLRWPIFRKIFNSPFFPLLPRILISIVFFAGLLALFFGPPDDPEKNIGLVLSWSIGWPLMLFSFFFLGRIWCSVCSLSLPGNLVQLLVRPNRSVPQFVKDYSGWIMAVFCIVVFWIELVWDAYRNTRLTGMIILGIILGAFFFSVVFKRRAWCRYVCPLGALNAVFAMPSIMELRANRHLCVNTCLSRLCYQGDESHEGCPMFRHPFLVDNNRDCILCGNCIKNCPHDSIQVNMRIAPLELWYIQAPRVADSFLIVSLAAIFFPLLRHQEFLDVSAGYSMPHLAGSLIMFGLIAAFILIYSVFSWQQAKITAKSFNYIFASTGYGFIPLVLGGFLAVYFEMFMAGAWRLIPMFMSAFGISLDAGHRMLSREATVTLQHLIVTGGLLASLYATYRIVKRYISGEPFIFKYYVLPVTFLLCSGVLFLLAL